jgi:hypothetical protein
LWDQVDRADRDANAAIFLIFVVLRRFAALVFFATSIRRDLAGVFTDRGFV